MVALIHRTGHTYGFITALHRVALPLWNFYSELLGTISKLLSDNNK